MVEAKSFEPDVPARSRTVPEAQTGTGSGNYHREREPFPSTFRNIPQNSAKKGPAASCTRRDLSDGDGPYRRVGGWGGEGGSLQVHLQF